MKLDLSIVPYDLLHRVVKDLHPFLETAAQYSKGRSSAADIVRACFTGNYQLWVVVDENTTFHGFFATEIKVYPRTKMLCIQHCVIEPHLMDEIEPMMQKMAEDFAKENGCAGIEFVGRPGWKKHALHYGYKAISVCYQRYFEEKTQ